MKSAGCIFTDGKFVLSGVQKYNNKYIISGIGGKRENGEPIGYTAIRELIEELFDVKYIHPELLLKISEIYPYKMKYFKKISYMLYAYTFDNLSEILKLAEEYITTTSLYETFPKNINDLIINRIPRKKTEIITFVLLPVIYNLTISNHFINDINFIVKENLDRSV